MMPTSGSMWLLLRSWATTKSVAPALEVVLDFAAVACGLGFAAWVGALVFDGAALAFFCGLPLAGAAEADDEKISSSATASIATRRWRHTIIARLPFSNRFARRMKSGAQAE